MILSLAMLVLYTSGIQGTAVAELNTDNVYEGLIKPDNVAIHVLQNTVNYVASSVAWGILTHFYQNSSRNRVKREDIENNDMESIDADAPEQFLHSTISTKKLAWLLHTLGDVADKFDKWSPDE